MDYPRYIEFEKLEELHPEVKLNQGMYESIDILLEGGEKLKKHVESFLVQKPDEDREIYCFRKKIFTYEPILGQCIAQLLNRMCVSNYVVEGLPKEGKEAKFWKSFRENINGQGQKEKDFLKEVFMNLLKYRKAFILVDKPEVEEEVISLRDEEKLGIAPYSVVYGGSTVAHYQETDGRLEWVKLRKLIYEYSPFEDTKCFLEYTFIDDTTMAQYKVEVDVDEKGVCTPKEWYHAEHETDEIYVPLYKQVEHGRGSIPIIKLELPQNLYVAKEAYFLCMEHIRVHNNLSYTSVIAGQIQRLFKPIKEGSDSMVDMAAAELQTGNDRVLIGESFSFNETTGSAITTVSSYLARLESRIKDIIFSNGLSNGTDRPMQESGVAKGMDFIAQEQALQSYGEKLIDALESLYRRIAEMRPLGVNPEEISISGMNEFVLDSVDAKINRMTLLDQLETELPDTVLRLLVEDLSRALAPYASSEEQAIIKEEILKIYEEADEFPELEINEVISLVQNQLLSNDTAQEVLGFKPSKEKSQVEDQMVAMAEVENKIADIMGAGEQGESTGEPGQQPTGEPVDPSGAVTLAELIAENTGLTTEEVLEAVEFNEQLAPEEMDEVIKVLAEQLSEITGAPVEEILGRIK